MAVKSEDDMPGEIYYEGISPLKGIKKLGMCVYDKIRDQADTRKRTERKHAPSEGSLGCRDRSSYPGVT